MTRTVYHVDRYDKHGRRLDYRYVPKLCDALRQALRWTDSEGRYAVVRSDEL